MFDSQPSQPAPQFRAEQLKEALQVLIRFVSNPVAGMKDLPDWPWPLLLICQAISGAVAGGLKGLVGRDLIGFFAGLIFVPISNAATVFVIAGFFFYTFSIYFGTAVDFRRLYTHLVFATLPALVVFIISPLLPPILLIGTAATAMLLYVSFVDEFHIPRQRAKRLLGGMFAVFVVFWIINTINLKNKAAEFREKATPESLDILERELKEK